VSDPFAPARARHALDAAGLPTDVDLVRADSVTNEVWLTETHVIRVNRQMSSRLRREAVLAPHLPAGCRYPRVVAYGGEAGRDWLVTERLPGVPLVRAWPSLGEDARRDAVTQVAAMVRELNRVQTPDDLPPADRSPQLLDPARLPVVAPLLDALDELDGLLPGAALIADARHLVLQSSAVLTPFGTEHLIHGDLHLGNVLWQDGRVTGMLDLEFARGAPADLDLDMLLRFCSHPDWFVPPDLEHVTRAAAYRDVPRWFRDEYPEVFAHEYILERMLLYSLAHDVHDLLGQLRDHPLEMRPERLPDYHAYKRIDHVLRGRSYLHRLAGHGWWETDPRELGMEGEVLRSRAADLPRRTF
jgi:aminoglycoside phosphotransferase (APT) family kinase protein